MSGEFQQPVHGRRGSLAASGLARRDTACDGEGRCPVAPLVFKTSLGAVRSSEGSTPSLLRHSLASARSVAFQGASRLRRWASPIALGTTPFSAAIPSPLVRSWREACV